MSKLTKIIIISFATVLFFSACSNDELNTEINKKMKNEDQIRTNMDESFIDFEFLNQDEENISLESLKGEYWISDLIFTNCTTVCIPMTSNMKRLQDEMIAASLDHIQLISFSVDPNFDTPEVLRDYAKQYDVNLDNWSFLTGYDFEEMKEISIKTFRSMLLEPGPGEDQVTHGTRFFLVNPNGDVIKNYDGMNGNVVEEIMDDLKKLQ